MLRRALELEKEIALVQKSTRTTCRFFVPIHNWFRMRSKMYYVWSLKPYSNLVHWAILILFILSSVPLVIFGLNNKIESSKASEQTYDFPRWEWVNPTPTGNNLNKIATCSDGVVWAVGDGGTILKSTDNGVTYSQEYTGVANNLKDIVCYSSSNIVAVGSNGQILQYNGYSWTNRAIGLTTQDIDSITFSSTGQFVAVGYNGIILYSADGLNWSIQGAGLTTRWLYSVTVSSTGQFVAVGNTGTILYSVDGLDWSIKGDGLTTQVLISVTVSSTGQFVAVGNTGTILYSADGLNWSIKGAGLTTQDLYSVKVSSTGQFVAVGTTGTILYSADGLNWSIQGAGLTTGYLYSVTVSSTGQFVAVGTTGTILYSVDGLNWSIKGAGLTTKLLENITVLSTGQFVAVGYTGTILYSADGLNWSIKGANLTSEGLYGVTVSSTGQFVAVEYTGTILYSADGINWSIQGAGLTTQGLFDVTVSSTGQFVAVGYTGTILYSADGVNWSIKAAGLTTRSLWGVAVSPAGQFVAVGNTGTILYSADGLNWSIQGAGLTTQGLFDVTVSPTGQFVATGSTGIILYSADGLNWSIQGAGLTTQWFQDVTVSSTGQFVAVGYTGTILYSADGLNWSIKAAGLTTMTLYSVTVSSTGQFVVVGDTGTILYSADGINWSIKGAGLTTMHLYSVTVSSTGQFVAVGTTGTILYSVDGLDWSIQGVGLTTKLFEDVTVSSTGQFVAVGYTGTILSYFSPANATAIKLLASLPGQSFADSTGVFGATNTVRAGDNVVATIYATDSSNILDKGNASFVGFTSTDPNDTNPGIIQLTQGGTCVQTDRQPGDPECGIGAATFTFHTPGTWTVTATDTNGILTVGTSSSITVLPGSPHHPRFTSSSISSPAGVASKITLGLADMYNNATSDPVGETINMISRDGSGNQVGSFSASENGPWTSSLGLNIPAGDPAVEPSSNKTADFWYLDFALNSATITASRDGLTSTTLPVTITEGVVDQNNSRIILSSSNIKAGETATATVTVSTSSADPAISLHSSRGSVDSITLVSNVGGVAIFHVVSNTSGSITLSAKDDTDDTWLQATKTLTINPDVASSIKLESDLSSVIAGNSISLKTTVLDKYGNVTGSGSVLLLSSSDKKVDNLPNSYTLKDNSSHTFSDVILKTSGNQTITASLKTDSGVTATATITVFTASFSPSSSYISVNNSKPILGKGNIYLETHAMDAYLNPVSGIEIALYFDNQYFKNATSATTKSSSLIKKILAASSNTDKYTTDASGKFVFELEPLKTGETTVYVKNVQTGELIGAPIEIKILDDTLLNNLSSLVNSLQNNETVKAIANVANVIIATAATLGLIPMIAALISSAPAAAHATAYAFSLGMEAIGAKKRRRSWGRVFDSTSGKGIDMAAVRLFDQASMKLVSTVVSDIKGHFSFQPEPGSYIISVIKDKYVFPTNIFAKYGIATINKSASRINSHYVGQTITVSGNNNFVNLEIPIDPYNKKATLLIRAKVFLSDFFELVTSELSYIFIPSIVIGSLLSIFAAIVLPTTRNITICLIYILVVLIYVISHLVKVRKFGIIYNSKTKKPISEAVVSVFDREYNTLKQTRLTDKFGRFSISVPKGSYRLKIEKEGYVFPSKKARKFSSKNRRHKDIYLGEIIVARSSRFINVSVPMDPTGKDLKKELKGLF